VLGLLFFFLILVSITLVMKTRDTNCVVVLVVDLVSHLIEKRSSLGLGDRLREGKG
jgi:Mg2+/citrate symporter